MAKLKQISNKCFPEEFEEYLEENGFMLSDTGDIFNKTFMKDDRAIVITADRASFRFFNASEDDQSSFEFSEHSRFEGLSTLNLMGWVFLLHAVQMIHINESINNYRRQSKKDINLKLHHVGSNTHNVVHLAENFFGAARTMMIAILILISSFSHAQVSGALRIGYTPKTNDPLFAGAINYSFKHVTVSADMMINTSPDQPVNFGLKGSYQYKFMEVRAGRYRQYYSADKESQYLNTWCYGVFATAHWKIYFMQYEYVRESKISFGLRQNL